MDKSSTDELEREKKAGALKKDEDSVRGDIIKEQSVAKELIETAARAYFTACRKVAGILNRRR